MCVCVCVCVCVSVSVCVCVCDCPSSTIVKPSSLTHSFPHPKSNVDKREDVIRFESDILPSAVPITGLMRAFLFVSSNCTDTDFVVKVTDVFPDGKNMLVQVCATST